MDVVLVSRNPVIVEAVLAASTAAGCQVSVVRGPEAVRARWRSSGVVLIGADSAAQVVGQGLPPRPGVHIVGAAADELVAWSVPLQASVVLLPDQVSLLTSVLAGRPAGADPRAVIVRVVGGSGGIGGSTLACALAQVGAARGLASGVVELDPCGGGLDLMFGAETEQGWRWADLASATGSIGDLRPHLPKVGGVAIVATRGSASGLDLDGEAAQSVVTSLARTHDLVVLDTGRGDSSVAELWPTCQTLLLVGADVRSVVAARARANRTGVQDASVVVRTGRGRRLPPEAVAEALGLPLAGAIGEDDRLPRALENGEPPARRTGRGYGRDVASLLDGLVA